jgi:hypothetical protein
MWHPRSALTRFIPAMPRIPNAVSNRTTSLSGKPVARSGDCSSLIA